MIQALIECYSLIIDVNASRLFEKISQATFGVRLMMFEP